MKKLLKKWWFWVLVVLVIGGIGSAIKGGSDNEGHPAPTKEAEKIEYTEVSADDLMNALNENALSASKTYKNTYVSVTGRLSNIDSDGKYIDIVPADDELAIIGIQCYTHGDGALVGTVSGLSKDSIVTVKGKITDVGEVIGYALDIDEIVTAE